VSTLTTPGPQAHFDKAPFDKYAWRRAVMLLHLTLTVLVGVYVVQGVGRPDTPADVTSSAPRVAVSGLAAAYVDARVVRADIPAAAVPAAAAATLASPYVADVVRVDFAQGDRWPVGAASRDTAAVSWPMGIVHRAFVHGPAVGPTAVSWLSRALPDDVLALGARVRFASKASGTVALTAWHTSVLAGSADWVPRTGMRLVASPGRWRLETIDRRGTETLAAGRYEPGAGAASFGLVRRGQEVWVTDPAGLVTQVSDPRVAALAGPWASWELRDNPGTRSVAIEEIWAG
jgi:hypothetical protein